jgi:hypothetical protein
VDFVLCIMTAATDLSTVPVLLQPFVILAKSATGAACADLIKQATSANGVYAFTALLEYENIRNVSTPMTALMVARWNGP